MSPEITPHKISVVVGYHNALHLTDDCIGINGAVTRLSLDGAEKGAVVGGDILHIVQHTVVPQVAGHIVQNKRVDLPLRIGGVVRGHRKPLSLPR